MRGLCREMERSRPRGLRETSGFDDAVDHPPLERLLRAYLFGEHCERGSALQPDDPRENESSAAVWDDADLRERLNEGRLTRRKDDIAGKCEVRPGTCRNTIHRAHDRLLERADGANNRIVTLANEV